MNHTIKEWVKKKKHISPDLIQTMEAIDDICEQASRIEYLENRIYILEKRVDTYIDMLGEEVVSHRRTKDYLSTFLHDKQVRS